MKKAKIVNGMLALFIGAPIRFYLFYKILQLVNATELMWFLFWVSIPLAIVIAVIQTVIEARP